MATIAALRLAGRSRHALMTRCKSESTIFELWSLALQAPDYEERALSSNPVAPIFATG
jgi:hypothetical protein